jgi:glycosyltransferase involved in cell wall biosynthesis
MGEQMKIGKLEQHKRELVKEFNAAKARYIKKYGNKIKYIYQENSGVAKARNHGIEDSSGSWILTLDADDLIDSNYIEHALKLIRNEQSLITSRAYFFDMNMNPIEKFYPEGDIDLNKTKFENMIKENYVVTTSLFSKSMWKKTGGYNEKLKRAEDWEFWVNMIKQGATVNYMEGKKYFKYRFHENSKSNKLINELKETIAYINNNHKNIL